jgi:hypothetical protein
MAETVRLYQDERAGKVRAVPDPQQGPDSRDLLLEALERLRRIEAAMGITQPLTRPEPQQMTVTAPPGENALIALGTPPSAAEVQAAHGITSAATDAAGYVPLTPEQALSATRRDLLSRSDPGRMSADGDPEGHGDPVRAQRIEPTHADFGRLFREADFSEEAAG